MKKVTFERLSVAAQRQQLGREFKDRKGNNQPAVCCGIEALMSAAVAAQLLLQKHSYDYRKIYKRQQ